MVTHITLHDDLLRKHIKARKICFAGNQRLKIAGTLHCASGKRMKKENRVFFRSMEEALHAGYRPCGHCMKIEYQKWKNGFIQ